MRGLKLLTAVVALACSAHLGAADRPGAPVKEATGEDRGSSVLFGGGYWNQASAAKFVERYDKAVTLTDDQKKAILDIFTGMEKWVEEFKTETTLKVRPALAALREAEKSKDKAAIAKAQKDLSDLLSPLRSRASKCAHDVKAVLTPEQTAVLEKKLAEERKVRQAKIGTGKTD